jgi:hypothetical protein
MLVAMVACSGDDDTSRKGIGSSTTTRPSATGLSTTTGTAPIPIPDTPGSFQAVGDGEIAGVSLDGEVTIAGRQRLRVDYTVTNDSDEAILVDLQPLNGPSYRVEAIGDPEKLQVEFARSSGPAFLQVLGTQGIESGVQGANELSLPAGRPQTLRWAARPSPEPGVTRQDDDGGDERDGNQDNDQDSTTKDGA